MPSYGHTTTTSAINAFMRVLLKEITDHWNKATVALSVVKPKIGKTLAGGRQVEYPHKIHPNTSVSGVRGHSGDWAKGSRGRSATAIIDVFPLNMTGGWGHIGELRTRKDIQAIRSVVEDAVMDIKDGFPLQINKLFYLDGRGIYARVSQVVHADMTFRVHAETGAPAAGTWGIRYLEEGQHFHATSDKALADPDRDVDAQIVSLDPTTNQYAVQGSMVNLNVDDYICIQDGLNNSPQGLVIALGDSVVAPDYGDVYLNIDRSLAANRWWRAQRKNLAGAGTVEDELIRIMTVTEKAIGKAPPIVLTEYEIYNNLWAQSTTGTGRQFHVTVGDKGATSYALGFDSLQVHTPHGALTIYGDKDCPQGEMMGIDPKDWDFATVDDGDTSYGGWFKGDNGNMYHQIDGTYGFKINWLWVYNLVCKKPRAQWRLSDVPRLAP